MESEFERNAFFVGISAVRITEENREERNRQTVQIGVNHFMLVANDSFDAEQTGRERAGKKWPEAEGWAQHSAEAAPISRDDVVEVLECFPDLAAKSDFEKPPEFVM